MLAELHIRDFAIIDELHLAFAPGFSVLTGETGAGKSIIVDAVSLALGGRTDSTVVRSGADRSLIEAVFLLPPSRQSALAPLLETEGLEGDDPGLLLVGREVRLNGRNVCRVNGRTVTLSLLRTATESLVDIHGQSEHLSILQTSEQTRLLDRYAGAWPLRQRVEALVQQVRHVRRELVALVLRDQEMAHRIDLLEFQIREIGAAALRPGEEEEWLAERVRLANAEQLASLLDEALRSLEDSRGETPTALHLVGVAIQALGGLARVDATLEPRLRAGESISNQLAELVGELRDYQDQIELNPQRLRVVEDRIALINQLKRKYGQTVENVLAYANGAAEELESITHSEARVVELRSEEARILEELGQQAWVLSKRRRAAARRMAQGIERELDDLRMEGSRFGVAFRFREDPAGVLLESVPGSGDTLVTSSGLASSEGVGPGSDGPFRAAFDTSGVDRVEFLVSPNPGEPLKPVTKIASGGETSRLMLALKSVLSHADETPTLVFDEIDQGIGGRVGATVGEKLWGLTSTAARSDPGRQVLCVTHLPQLAGFGDVHLHVEKQALGERTVTRVRALDGATRVAEIAQMLGASGEAGNRSAEAILQDIVIRKRRANAAVASPRATLDPTPDS